MVRRKVVLERYAALRCLWHEVGVIRYDATQQLNPMFGPARAYGVTGRRALVCAGRCRGGCSSSARPHDSAHVPPLER
eukprot:4379950-Prymnesium_polylepis.1